MKNNLHFLKDIFLFSVAIVMILSAIVVVSNNFVLEDQVENGQSSIQTKKSVILAMVKNSERLSPLQKDYIGRAIIGDNIKLYGFNNEEKKIIISTLNKN